MASLVFVLPVFCAGCGQEQPLAPVQGLLTIDGQPAANIAIQFMPDVTQDNSGPTSFAISDAQGQFVLKTYDGREGAVLGMHRVVLADLDEERPPQGQPMQRPPRLAGEYIGQSSPLLVEVRENGAPITLEAFGPK